MPTGGRAGQVHELLVERFLGFVTEGRGDLARGRHVYLLRALDALWDPDGVLDFPYRPTRNPGAFLAMTFDLVGDAGYGYSLLLDGGGTSSQDQLDTVSSHLRARLLAPWPRLVSDLRRLSMPHLGRMVAGFVPDILERSQLSRLPAELARLRGRMTTTQLASFDRDAYLAELSFARVLRLVGWSGDRSYPSAKEQHPTGGDLRALLRKRLDAPWAAALRHMSPAGPTDVLATMPAVVERRAERSGDAGGEDDFAVAYSLSSDAPAPGRRWHAPEPFVTSEGREEFEFMTGRGAADGAVRRSTRLERWGASLVFPEAYALVDVRLESTPGMEPLHAGAPWRELVAASGAEVAAVRREFTQQVAARMADSTDADRGPEPTGESRQSETTRREEPGVVP